MPTLRQLQAEWNALVPIAWSHGIYRVRTISSVHESVSRGQERVEWLRARIASRGGSVDAALRASTAQTAPAVVAAPGELTFGVEVECLMPVGMTRADLAALVTNAGVHCVSEHYNHGVRTYWKVIQDGSLGDYVRGVELVSPILTGEAGFQAMRRVIEEAKRQGCTVDRRCGFHVHVGARSENVQFFKNLFATYAHYEAAIDGFMSPSRRGSQNVYCKPTDSSKLGTVERSRTVDTVVRAANGRDRYFKLNLTSFWRHGTIEFRHHQGTVEAHKAENWTRLCLRMVGAARQAAPTGGQDLASMLAFVQAPQAEVDYFTGRAARFGGM